MPTGDPICWCGLYLSAHSDFLRDQHWIGPNLKPPVSSWYPPITEERVREIVREEIALAKRKDDPTTA